eukprot:scaffold14801_cov105-Isochrysis_galbana.AAC.5
MQSPRATSGGAGAAGSCSCTMAVGDAGESEHGKRSQTKQSRSWLCAPRHYHPPECGLRHAG